MQGKVAFPNAPDITLQGSRKLLSFDWQSSFMACWPLKASGGGWQPLHEKHDGYGQECCPACRQDHAAISMPKALMTAIRFRLGQTPSMHYSLRPPFGPGNIWSATCCCAAASAPAASTNGSDRARGDSLVCL